MITQGFPTQKEKCHLMPASGLNLVNKELPPGSRIEKNNGRDQAVRAQGQVRLTSCIYTRTLLVAAKNKSDYLSLGFQDTRGGGESGYDRDEIHHHPLGHDEIWIWVTSLICTAKLQREP